MTKLGASTRVIDLSSRMFYDAIDNTDARMAANYSENAQEILIKNKIPKQAIVSMYSFQPLVPETRNQICCINFYLTWGSK